MQQIHVPPGEPDPVATRLELQHYVFRNRLRKAKRAYDRIYAKGGRTFEVSWILGERGPFRGTPFNKASLEFAVVMSDFILPGQLLNLESIYDMLNELSPSDKMKQNIEAIKAELDAVENASPAIATPQGVRKNARELFVDVCQNIIFNSDIPAHAFVEGLNRSPQGTDVWKHFHNYCLAVFSVLQRTQEFIHENDFYPRPVRSNKCIFCKSYSVEFKNVEHVLSESLGNEASILPRGYVCKSCNNELSSVESVFLDNLPMSMLRLQATNVDKDGKFPSAKYDKMHSSKTSCMFCK